MSGITQVALAGATAPEEPQYRAPARRISAAGQADRTAQAFEGALSEFKAMFESMQEEIATLRKEVTDLRAQAAEGEASAGAALKGLADTISELKLVIKEQQEKKASHDEVREIADRLGGLQARYDGHTHLYNSYHSTSTPR